MKATSIAKALTVIFFGGISCFYLCTLLGFLGLVSFFASISIAFFLLGKRWEMRLKRPALKDEPFVSIIIPAFRSEEYIKDTIIAAKALDWNKKEIIVINDSRDRTPQICKELGVRCIQNKKRLGKAISLNKALKYAKGDFVFFIDSDTVVEKDCLKKMIPWFSDKRIAVVAPKYLTKNTENIIAKFTLLENIFNQNLCKIHMLFGGMPAFRGCAVIIRKDVLLKVGGWPKTLSEDLSLSRLIIQKGFKIHFDPTTTVYTIEPNSIKSLSKQRKRWGRMAFYEFYDNKSYYLKNPQFFIHTFPVIFSFLVFTGAILWQTVVILPIAAYLFYISAAKEILAIFLYLLFSTIANLSVPLGPSFAAYTAILSIPETKKDAFLIFPYLLIYVPIATLLYARAILIGLFDRIRKKPEFDFSFW
ncbi:MAG: glycosyltransferase family 2 protein [Candidatus Aenigmatarchaeota archaeon]